VTSGLVDPTRAEHGCLAYDLFESASMPGTFITVELWRDQSDVDAHMQTAHIAAALAASEAHLAAPPGILGAGDQLTGRLSALQEKPALPGPDHGTRAQHP
jgi:quinol monooxygenase YgiN